MAVPDEHMTLRQRLVLVCVGGASFVIMLDTNIVAVALPAIARDLHASFQNLEWVVSAFFLSLISLMIPAGSLADRHGRRFCLIVGLTIFTSASALCGWAPDPVILGIARALQGLGAALQLSASLGILGHEFRGAQRAKAFAIWGMVVGIAVTLGPIVGGVITSAFGWPWAFLINVPVGVTLVILARIFVTESANPDAGHLDWLGIPLWSLGCLLLVWALIDASSAGWSDPGILLRLLAAALLLTCFAWVERRQTRPMIDLDLFAHPTFLGGTFAMMSYAIAAQVMLTFLPLYLENSFGATPLRAGLEMIPFTLPLFLCPRLGGWLSRRYTGRTILALGLAAATIGDLVMALTATQLDYAWIAAGMILTGCGAGLLNGETVKVQTGVAPVERGAVASGMSGTSRLVALVIGVAGLGAVLSSRTLSAFQHALPADLKGSDANVTLLVRHITSGDIPAVLAALPVSARASVSEIARTSFAQGFSALQFVGAAIGLAGVVLTLALVRRQDTLPRGAPAAQTPPALPLQQEI
jgi:EmrB/QacA subfamily drug resistance transporter